MVECQWDSVVLSPYSPVLTGLEVTFMCLTQSNSSLFSTPGFVVSPVGKRERGGRKKRKRKKKKTHTHTKQNKDGKEGTRNKKGGKEGRREEGIQKDQRHDKKEF